MFREKIRNTMTAKKMSRKELSVKSGICESTISSFLTGKRAISNDNLDALMNALGLALVRVDGFQYEPVRVKAPVGAKG